MEVNQQNRSKYKFNRQSDQIGYDLPPDLDAWNKKNEGFYRLLTVVTFLLIVLVRRHTSW